MNWHQLFLLAGLSAFLAIIYECILKSRRRKAPLFLPLEGLLRERPDLPNPNPVRPGPGPEERLRELQRRFRAVEASKRPSDFSRLCESTNLPPKEQASRLREHFGILGGARPPDVRLNKRPRSR